MANEEVGALYASAGVVLNDHHDDMRRDRFLSNRLFDAAACAARIAHRRDRRPRRDLRRRWSQPFHDEHELGPLLADPPYAAFPDNATRRRSSPSASSREHTFDQRAETLSTTPYARCALRPRR